MVPDNWWYGHNVVLAHYCGHSGPRAIYGYIPHGWFPDYLQESMSVRIRSAPLLSWNGRHASQARKLGVEKVVPIGAPFLYALRNLYPNDDPPTGSGTLVFPSHSAEAHQVQFNVEMVRTSVAAQFPGPYSVALHYQDLQKPHVDRFRQLGWRVVSFGNRSEPRFLYRQIAEIARSEFVVSDAPSSALWYAGAMGRSIHLASRSYAIAAGSEQQNRIDWAIERYASLPDLADPEESRRIAGMELGAEFMRSPAELRKVLGWASVTRTSFAYALRATIDLRFGTSLRKGEPRAQSHRKKGSA